MRVSGEEVHYGCTFTTERMAGDCRGPTWQRIGLLPAHAWRTGRQFYDHVEDGIPRVRPYPTSAGYTLNDGSEMSLGKSHQVWTLVRRLGPEASVLKIGHRIAAIRADMESARELGCTAYLDEAPGPICARRVLITINSLWRIEHADWDLVVLDETPEVISALVGLKPCNGRGGRWVVWRRLRDIFLHAKRRICLSAQSDDLVQEFFRGLGATDVSWQQHRAMPLARMQYKVAYTNSFAQAWDEIEARLRRSEHLMVSFSEAGHLRLLFDAAREVFPEKRFIAVHAGLADSEKREAVANITALLGGQTTAERYSRSRT